MLRPLGGLLATAVLPTSAAAEPRVVQGGTEEIVEEVPVPGVQYVLGPPSIPDGEDEDRSSAARSVRAEGATIRGALDPLDVQRVLGRQLAGIGSCYERALAGDPELRGRVVLLVDVAEDGAVSAIEPGESGLESPAVIQCAAAVLRRASFVAPHEPVHIRLPLVFGPQGADEVTEKRPRPARD